MSKQEFIENIDFATARDYVIEIHIMSHMRKRNIQKKRKRKYA